MRLIQNSNARETSRFSLRVELVKKKEKKRKVYSLKVDKRLDSKIRTSQLNHSCSTTLSSTRVWTGATDDRFTKSQRFHSFRKTILRGAAFFVEHGKIRRRRPFVSLSLSLPIKQDAPGWCVIAEELLARGRSIIVCATWTSIVHVSRLDRHKFQTGRWIVNAGKPREATDRHRFQRRSLLATYQQMKKTMEN